MNSAIRSPVAAHRKRSFLGRLEDGVEESIGPLDNENSEEPAKILSSFTASRDGPSKEFVLRGCGPGGLSGRWR